MIKTFNAILIMISVFTSGLSILAYITHNEADAIFFLGLAILNRVWVIEERTRE